MEKVFGWFAGVVVVLGLGSVAVKASADTTIQPVYQSSNVKHVANVNAGMSANDAVFFPHISTSK